MTRFTSKVNIDLPLLGIDLGYSAKSKSCGLASSLTNTVFEFSFGACVDEVITHFNQAGPHILIVEAVLSTFHLPNGNPSIRGEFEKGRGWYHGPGVTTYAAAIRFLQQLDQKLPSDLGSIPIVEGFLSYKPERTTHSEDAFRLVNEFHIAEAFEPALSSEPILNIIDRSPKILRYNKPHGASE